MGKPSQPIVDDLVPLASATISVVATAYFLLEFQFTGLRDRIRAAARHVFRR